MKLTVAQHVVVFNFGMERAPVFHLSRDMVKTADEPHHRAFEVKTYCGELIESWSFDPTQWGDREGTRANYTYVRFDHASLIGRPCKNCERAS